LRLNDWDLLVPARKNGTGALRAKAAALSDVRIRSTGVLGRNVGGPRVDCSVLDGGRSYRVGGGRAGDCVARIAGKDRFKRSSCAFVVVGSVVRSDACDAIWPSSLLRGVDGVMVCVEEGVVGVVMLLTLVTEECAECPPMRDKERLDWPRWIGPPLSETGSSEDCVCDRSWLTIGRGRRDTATGLFVNLRATEALGREGLAGLVALT
jgi:hypothetical protein